MVILWKPVVYAVDSATISAHVRDELLGPADGAALHECRVIGLRALLKSCLLEVDFRVTRTGDRGLRIT